ncbi:MAG: hypothetical protein AAF750_07405 [Planctomycetota bacterium]
MAFHHTRLPITCLTLCLVLSATTRHADPKPIPARLIPTPAKDTTYFLGPLRPDGTVDYIAALNQKLSQGITPDNNAAYALLAVMPPERLNMDGHGGIPKLEAAFGVPFLNPRPTYQGVPSRDQDDPVGRQFDLAIDGPWAPEHLPAVADWLNNNQAALEAVIRAVERDMAWWPIITKAPEAMLYLILLPELGETRSLARGLVVRAHRALAHGDLDAVIRDWRAIQKLGHHTSANPIIISRLVGYSIQTMADHLAVRLLAHPDVTVQQVQQMAIVWAAVYPVPSIADAIDFVERIMLLQSLQAVAAGRIPPEDFFDGRGRFAVRSPAFRIDPALRQMNRRYDQLVQIAELQRFQAFNESLARFQEELETAQDPVTGIRGRHGDASERFSAWLGDSLAGWSLLSLDSAFASNLDANSRLELLQLAIALRLHRFEHQRYPATLDALTPKYIAKLPVDRYDGRPLTYKPGPDGTTYLLYAVGRNGQDDGGRHDPREADIAVGDPMPAGW